MLPNDTVHHGKATNTGRQVEPASEQARWRFEPCKMMFEIGSHMARKRKESKSDLPLLRPQSSLHVTVNTKLLQRKIITLLVPNFFSHGHISLKYPNFRTPIPRKKPMSPSAKHLYHDRYS